MDTRAKTSRQTQVKAAQDLELMLSDAVGMVEGAMNQALDFCVQKMGLDDRPAVVARLKEGDRETLDRFSYRLASQAAEWLGAWDESIKAVYLYDYDATVEDTHFGTASRSPMLHFIVWASRKTGALTSILEVLDRALAQGYADLTGKQELKHMLSAEAIDDEGVQNSIGGAALLRSVHTRPLRVWER